MADLFPLLRSDDKAQIGDKLRLDASKSFVSPSATITKYEFDPEGTATWIDAGTVSYLDWVYTTAGTKTAGLRITSGSTATITLDIDVVTAADDRLFSDDASLVEIEPTIMKYLPAERSSFKYAHRRSQTHILDSFDQRRIWEIDGSKVTAEDLIDLTEVSVWSTLLTLGYIFQGLSNAVDDVFDKKSKMYLSKADAARHLALRYDYNKDGELEPYEGTDLFTGGLVRR